MVVLGRQWPPAVRVRILVYIYQVIKQDITLHWNFMIICDSFMPQSSLPSISERHLEMLLGAGSLLDPSVYPYSLNHVNTPYHSLQPTQLYHWVYKYSLAGTETITHSAPYR